MGVDFLSRLPLTPLELNVVTHVLCARFLVENPHDAGLPILLPESRLRRALSYTMDMHGPQPSCSIEKKLPPVVKHSSHDITSCDPNEIRRQSRSTPSIGAVDEKD